MSEAELKRRENERKFGIWEELPGGLRRYSYEIEGRYGWMVRYGSFIITVLQLSIVA